MASPSLIETMRVVEGRIPLLAAHLRRYRDSAYALGYEWHDWEREAAARAAALSDSVLRAQIDPGGNVQWSTRPLPDACAIPVVMVSRLGRDTSNPLLQYKNTSRQLYRNAAAEAEQVNVDFVLIQTLEGRITETSIHTLLFRAEGRWWTPPLDDGLLAGVVRSELLRRTVVEERSFTVEEALYRPRIALCNAVVGVIAARWAGA